MTFVSNRLIGICMLLIFIVITTNCERYDNLDITNIVNQLPKTGVVLTADYVKNTVYDTNRFITFSRIKYLQTENGHIFTEKEFYDVAHTSGAQYILIPSEMQVKGSKDFPWITNKRFQVCPGDPDHKSDGYFILLNWDNSKNTYHFFKFLYNEE
jgi:hypothetical protein